MKPTLKGRGEAYEDEIVALRRHLHRYPELSGEEHATSRTVQEKLEEHGIPFTAGYAGTGVLGVVDGGKPGAPSRKTLIRADGETVDLPSKISGVPVFAGDRLVFETAGAGGVGDPLERDPALVAKDVRWALIGAEAAATDYGVVVAADGSVDEGATEAKRQELRGSRGERPGFDHGDLPELEEQRRAIADTRRRFNEWLSGELGAARANGKR